MPLPLGLRRAAYISLVEIENETRKFQVPECGRAPLRFVLDKALGCQAIAESSRCNRPSQQGNKPPFERRIRVKRKR
jgi:hypothetical protein